MKKSLIFLFIIMSLYSKEIKWKKACSVNSMFGYVDVYKNKTLKSQRIGSVNDIFYVKVDSSDLWKIRGDDDGRILTGYAAKKNIYLLSTDADFIDVFILQTKYKGIDIYLGKSMEKKKYIKIPSKIIKYIEKLLKNNRDNKNKKINIKFTEEELPLLKIIQKRIYLEGVGSYEDLEYTQKTIDANKILVYMKTIMDLERIIGNKLDSNTYYYKLLLEAHKFLGNKNKVLFYLNKSYNL